MLLHDRVGIRFPGWLPFAHTSHNASRFLRDLSNGLQIKRRKREIRDPKQSELRFEPIINNIRQY